MVSIKHSNKRSENFKIFKPTYSFIELSARYAAIAQTITKTAWIVGISKLRKKRLAFGASLEITDRCNAGCRYCYVYPADWDQTQRVQGYMQLNSGERNQKTQTLYQVIDKISDEGKVLITLVGGEPTLASDLIDYASSKFPVVWVVTNGAKPLPNTSKSVVYFVSIDGPPNFHNESRDPAGFFKAHRYKDLSGMSAAIVRNINESHRGAYIHITLNKASIRHFPETVHWLCRDIDKLRGVVVSGAATYSTNDAHAISPRNRLEIKRMIEDLAQEYGWDLFPFNNGPDIL